MLGGFVHCLVSLQTCMTWYPLQVNCSCWQLVQVLLNGGHEVSVAAGECLLKKL
jgi:hypothetical protein